MVMSIRIGVHIIFIWRALRHKIGFYDRVRFSKDGSNASAFLSFQVRS